MSEPSSSQQGRCPFCGHPLRVVEVHGHGQCSVCGTNLQPCCDGEHCAARDTGDAAA